MIRGTKISVVVLTIVMALTYPLSATAGGNKTVQAGMGFGGGDMQKPLEVKGQTRNISMLVVNQAEKDKLKFVSARRDFRDQILGTKY